MVQVPADAFVDAFIEALGRAKMPATEQDRQRLLACFSPCASLDSKPSLVSAWMDRLVSRVPAAGWVAEVESLKLADLWLAYQCGQGVPQALSQFDQKFGVEVDRAQRTRARSISREDFVQALRERLFAGPEPRILTYTGTGELRAWVRMAASRLAVDLIRKRQESPSEDSGQQPCAADDDPELAYMKARYGNAFQSAFENAVGTLGSEDRNLLRGHYAYRMNVDQLGTALGIHRATAARRLQRAKEELLRKTEEGLRLVLGVDDTELRSILRVIESQLHVSVRRLLQNES